MGTGRIRITKRSSMNYMVAPGIPKLTPEGLIKEVCNYFSVSLSDIVKHDRRRSIAMARQICSYLLKINFDLSYRQIGEMFGGRDHTTSIHSINVVLDELSVHYNNDYKECLEIMSLKGINISGPIRKFPKKKKGIIIKPVEEITTTEFIRPKAEYSNKQFNY